MIPNRLILPLLGTASVFLSACASTVSSDSESRVKLQKWVEAERYGMEKTDKPRGLEIPVVDFGKLPSSFGKASWSAGKEGQYSIGYHKDAKIAAGECYHVSVFGTPAPAPVLGDAPSVLEPGRPGEMDENPRTWSTVEVPGLNRKLRYYFSTMAFGDADDTWETEPFSVTGPDGNTGYYQARIECENDDVAKAMFAKLRAR